MCFFCIKNKECGKHDRTIEEGPNIHIHLTTFEHPKAIELSNVSDLVDDKVSIVSLWQFGLAEILEKMTDEDALVVTGSLYFISDVRNLLLQLGGNDEL